jgi:PIN domain nuclease of toxin-antitoxin system
VETDERRLSRRFSGKPLEVRVLLDTVTFLCAVSSPERISRKAMSALTQSSTVPEVSVISLPEIAINQARGKLTFAKRDVAQGTADLRLRMLPYSREHSMALFALPVRHADPFDRQIIAQALAEQIAVITSDSAFKLYKGLDVIW